MGRELSFFSICGPYRHQLLIYLIHKLLRILRSLRPYENRRINPYKVSQPARHTTNWWVLPLNNLLVYLVSHGKGLHSHDFFHMG